jgi:hypothetical protein
MCIAAQEVSAPRGSAGYAMPVIAGELVLAAPFAVVHRRLLPSVRLSTTQVIQVIS